MIGMKDQCFGVEVEMTGLTRGQAAQALANYFGTEPYYVGGGYDKWSVKDPDGKVWSIMSDSSIVTEMKTEIGYMHTSNIEYRVEMVTPKLTYAELPRLQECVRQVRHAGAKVNHSCGIHVHVDAANHNRQSLKNLLSIMYSKEDILFKALQVNYALNLHSVFYSGTVEWRCFNSTLHAGKVAAYVNLCLAMSAQAINQRSTVMRKTYSDNELFTFRVWLVRLGLNGDEFKNTRNHLLANLDGDRAWRYDKDSYEVNKKKKKSREMER